MLPNPSLNRSANGRPPHPGRWCAHIFTGPGAVACRRRPVSSNVRAPTNAYTAAPGLPSTNGEIHRVTSVRCNSIFACAGFVRRRFYSNRSEFHRASGGHRQRKREGVASPSIGCRHALLTNYAMWSCKLSLTRRALCKLELQGIFYCLTYSCRCRKRRSRTSKSCKSRVGTGATNWHSLPSFGCGATHACVCCRKMLVSRKFLAV